MLMSSTSPWAFPYSLAPALTGVSMSSRSGRLKPNLAHLSKVDALFSLPEFVIGLQGKKALRRAANHGHDWSLI